MATARRNSLLHQVRRDIFTERNVNISADKSTDNMNIKNGSRALSVRGNLDRMITDAVNEAVKAWDDNEELRNLYNRWEQATCSVAETWVLCLL